MIYGDKQFGQKRFLFPTPEDTPEEIACRTFRIPSNAAWLGLFMGAVSLLTDPENYQQFDGGMSREEAAETAQAIIDFVYEHVEDGCTACLLPTGEPIIRIAANGAVQQLTPEGWQTPTGDYEPPPVTPREGGTPQDQMCLAAANAMNTLKILYETISDAWNGGLTNAETLSELLLAIAAIIAAAVALWAAAIIALVIVVWDIIYDTLEYVLADLWDTNVDAAIQCILYNCASNDAGVVTFDYDCVINQLAAQTDVTGSLTFDQLRLFGQLVYILQFIGGDGLNLAGATTAITEADCEECIEWCYEWEAFGDWTIPVGYAQGSRSTAMYINFGSTTVTRIEFDYTWNLVGGGAGSARAIWGQANFGGSTILYESPLPNLSPAGTAWEGSQVMTGVTVAANATPGGGRVVTITRILLRGIGTNPFGEDNCEP